MSSQTTDCTYGGFSLGGIESMVDLLKHTPGEGGQPRPKPGGHGCGICEDWRVEGDGGGMIVIVREHRQHQGKCGPVRAPDLACHISTVDS